MKTYTSIATLCHLVKAGRIIARFEVIESDSPSTGAPKKGTRGTLTELEENYPNTSFVIHRSTYIDYSTGKRIN